VNNSTRVLAWKATRREPPTLHELRQIELEVGVEQLELARRRDIRAQRRRADQFALECAVGSKELIEDVDDAGACPDDRGGSTAKVALALTGPVALEARRQMLHCLGAAPSLSLAELRGETARLERELA
jgi:hypothetical protein